MQEIDDWGEPSAEEILQEDDNMCTMQLLGYKIVFEANSQGMYVLTKEQLKSIEYQVNKYLDSLIDDVRLEVECGVMNNYH